ncbi:MAG: type 1 glutamine amidotransferase [Salinigranum sp.]
MDRLRLALLDASHNDGATRRNFRRELDADLAEFEVIDGELPPAPGDAPIDAPERGRTVDRRSPPFDGVVVTGSRSSVYDDEEWIDPLLSWLEAAAESGLPILGVCYGHQALATALGGRVEPMGRYEIGYREVTHHGDELFAGLDEAFLVFTTHRDAVTELPPGAELTAENDYGIHGFRKGHCFGVQFHPEYDAETARRITRGKDLPDERIAAVLDDVTPENYAAACEAKRLFDNFTEYVRRVAPRSTA